MTVQNGSERDWVFEVEVSRCRATATVAAAAATVERVVVPKQSALKIAAVSRVRNDITFREKPKKRLLR